MAALYPLKFKPVYKDYPWGNNRLPELFGRKLPQSIYAESWEVSTHRDGESIIANGMHAGMRFSDLLRLCGRDILGSAVEGNDFPLLIKLIDAAQPLSVQVHPNNSNAGEINGEPKTEMWYFLNDDPSHIYCGLTPGTSCADFLAAIENESFEAVLRKVPAVKGGAAYVPGGRVHAIGAGCLILEIQQNSNTTYRVYDWGRIGADGQSRELHVDKALQVIDFKDAQDPVCVPVQIAPGIRRICSSSYFILDEVCIDGTMTFEAFGSTFHVFFSADKAFEIKYDDGLIETVSVGTSVLIPASMGRFEIIVEGAASILKTSIPDA